MQHPDQIQTAVVTKTMTYGGQTYEPGASLQMLRGHLRAFVALGLVTADTAIMTRDVAAEGDAPANSPEDADAAGKSRRYRRRDMRAEG